MSKEPEPHVSSNMVHHRAALALIPPGAWLNRATVITVGVVLAATLLLLATPAVDPLVDRLSAVPLDRMLDALGKLGAAVAIGLLVTAVHRPATREASGCGTLAQAQVLLCVSGALMMLIIQDSVARAFGIAGAASVVRFRTPVDDPKDAAVLFLLIGLGMASGLGVLALAATGTAVLCALLVALDRRPAQVARTWVVVLSASGPIFPSAHVLRVFGRHHVIAEPRELSGGERATTTYIATCEPTVPLDVVTAELRGGGIESVSWAPAKRRQL